MKLIRVFYMDKSMFPTENGTNSINILCTDSQKYLDILQTISEMSEITFLDE